MSGDNGVEESIDGGKGGCVGPYIVFYVYLVSSLLTQHGYSETSTPMLFRHHTYSTAFTLTVDDFLIRYSFPPL